MSPRELTEQEIERVSDAVILAINAHDGTYRGDGVPYVVHPIRIALHAASLGLSTQTILAALLHDVVDLFSAEIGHKVKYAFFVTDGNHAAEIKIRACADTPVSDIESLGEDTSQKAHPDPLRSLSIHVDLGSGFIVGPFVDRQQQLGWRIGGPFSRSPGLGRICQRIGHNAERPHAQEFFADEIDLEAGSLIQHKRGLTPPGFKQPVQEERKDIRCGERRFPVLGHEPEQIIDDVLIRLFPGNDLCQFFKVL